MAKFGSYFGLCPLIDHRSLLGISKDSQNGKVLVTLGRNIAMQYRLSDQKQIISWTTKEKFTSAVIFDAELQQYVAVFNQMYIRCWKSDVTNLDKVKKYKFSANIDTLLLVGGSTFVVFQNGAVIKLQEAISAHKTLEPDVVLAKNEYINNILSCSTETNIFIGLIIGNSSSETVELLCNVFGLNGNLSDNSRIKLKRDSCELVGSTFHVSNKEVELLTLWSDGKLCIQTIPSDLEIFSIIESISCKDPVSLVSLDKDYIAMYGSNSNQEGALLVIYNMQFKVTQCKQSFKLVTIGAKLFMIEDKLLLPVGQNLAVIPYYLEKEQLSSLIGSHKITQNNDNKDVVVVQNLEEVEWSKKNIVEENVDENLKKMAQDYLNQGYPECVIFQELVTKYLETNDINSLEILLRTFDDIPEKHFAELLRYFLELPRKNFKHSKLYPHENYPENLQPTKRFEILTLILQKPINENLLIPHLRSLCLNSVLNLLGFILFSLVNNDNNVEEKNKLIQWLCILLDANYQTFVLSKDENVLKILLSLTELIDDELSCLDDLDKLLSLLKQLGKKKKSSRIVSNNNYVVERIEL